MVPTLRRGVPQGPPDGEHRRWDGTEQLFHELTALPLETINPFYGFDVCNLEVEALEPVSGIAVATGLADAKR